MSGNHDANRPSQPPRRASYYREEDNEDVSYILVFGLPNSYILRSASSIGMPSPERNRYSNKESAKVNAGLEFCRNATEEDILEEATDVLATKAPAVDIDFSQLIAPIVAPEPKPDIAQVVRRLLQPPPHAFVYGVLSIQWVRGEVGVQHFDFHESDERYVLSQDSELRMHGGELGVPAVYMEWLCGDSEEVSSTEQSMYLTREFFEEIKREILGAQCCSE